MTPGEGGRYGPLSREECLVLADALGESPETVISVHQLRRGLCKAYVAGKPDDFEAAVVQCDHLREEPNGFGRDPEALWEVLRQVDCWTCVDVATDVARPLGKIISDETGQRVRYYGDVYLTQDGDPPDFHNPAVGLLGPADVDLVAAAGPELRPSGFGPLEACLAEGLTAAAIVGGAIVSMANAVARTALYCDIGVYTIETHRGRGYATAAAAVVSALARKAGETCVWSAGERNAASLRVAAKLGFTEVSRRMYVILQQHENGAAV